jgi:mono/diheme cytochrome c family protein
MRAWLLALALLPAKAIVPVERPIVYAIQSIDEASGPSHSLALGKIEKQALAFVADEDEHAILTFSTKEMAFVSRTHVRGKPSSVRIHEGKLAVTMRDRAEIVFYEARKDGLVPASRTQVCDEPVSTNADGAELFVVCASGHLDVVKHGRRIREHDLPREPRAVVAEGSRLYVSHAVGSRMSVIDRSSGKVEDVSLSVPGLPETLTAQRVHEAVIFGVTEASLNPVPDETKRRRFATQGFSLARWRDRIFLPETLVAPDDVQEKKIAVRDDTPRPTGYGGSLGLVSRRLVRGPVVSHLAAFKTRDFALAPADPSENASCPLPRAAAALPDGRIVVACLGSDAVVVWNGDDAHVAGQWLVASGPTGIAVSDEKLFVWSQFDRQLTRADMGFDDFQTASDTLERKPTPFEVGRKLFHRTDAFRISADVRGCASCHPDGRDDGLMWSSPDGPRQTPTLAGRLSETAPYGWTGKSETVRAHMKETLARLGGTGLDDASTYALLAYCARMAPPPSSRAIDTARLRRGRAIFDSYETGCSGCHDPARRFTDGARYDVGTNGSFETPSLVGVGRTAPYFHDGRFATLEDLLAKSPEMAPTKHLATAELDDLAYYLRSL